MSATSEDGLDIGFQDEEVVDESDKMNGDVNGVSEECDSMEATQSTRKRHLSDEVSSDSKRIRCDDASDGELDKVDSNVEDYVEEVVEEENEEVALDNDANLDEDSGTEEIVDDDDDDIGEDGDIQEILDDDQDCIQEVLDDDEDVAEMVEDQDSEEAPTNGVSAAPSSSGEDVEEIEDEDKATNGVAGGSPEEAEDDVSDDVLSVPDDKSDVEEVAKSIESEKVTDSEKSKEENSDDAVVELNDTAGAVSDSPSKEGVDLSPKKVRRRKSNPIELQPVRKSERSRIIGDKLKAKQLAEQAAEAAAEQQKKKQLEQRKARMIVKNATNKREIDPLDLRDPLCDPLGESHTARASASTLSTSSSTKKNTIIVNDTKTLVELAVGNKEASKEPTLVIIDTNSILSGKGPIPVRQQLKNSGVTMTTTSKAFSIPTQSLSSSVTVSTGSGLTVMAIPSSSSAARSFVGSATTTTATSSTSSLSHSKDVTISHSGLTDDMFVVEAPSFIVPYVYEKPPLKSAKELVDKDAEEAEAKSPEKAKDEKKDDKDKERKTDAFFDGKLGKFFIQIGMSLVQEYVQTDLLRAQKRKADREMTRSPATHHAIQSLLRNLEDSKENNEPYRFKMRKCTFCNFRTESELVMSQHLETPHMKQYTYRCNFCEFETRVPQDILFHIEAEHNIRGRLERAPSFHQCPNCSFEDNSKGKLSRHLMSCQKKFRPERNQDPPPDWEPPAKVYRVSRGRGGLMPPSFMPFKTGVGHSLLPKMGALSPMPPPLLPTSIPRTRGRPPGPASMGTKLDGRTVGIRGFGSSPLRTGMLYRPSGSQVFVPSSFPFTNSPIYQVGKGKGSRGRHSYEVVGNQGHVLPMMTGSMGSGSQRLTLIPSSSSSGPSPVTLIPNLSSGASSITIQSASGRSSAPKTPQQPSISITPLPRPSAASTNITPVTAKGATPTTSKTTFVICEICDGYIKDLEQLRNHMQWIHKVKIHPKMIYNRPPLNCQKCQFRFFTDQGLERHLLGCHGLVTSSMKEAANKGQDSGRCPVCGKVYQWKLLNHVAKDHNLTLKPAHLSYKCTVCTATFDMYKLFESHVYSAHSVVTKRGDKKNPAPSAAHEHKPTSSALSSSSLLKPLKINDEITIIPQPVKVNSQPSTSQASQRMGKKLVCQ